MIFSMHPNCRISGATAYRFAVMGIDILDNINKLMSDLFKVLKNAGHIPWKKELNGRDLGRSLDRHSRSSRNFNGFNFEEQVSAPPATPACTGVG